MTPSDQPDTAGDAATDADASRSTRDRLCFAAAWLVALAAIAPSIAAWSARLHWTFDLWTAFPLHRTIVAGFAAVIAMLLRVRSAATVAGVVAILSGASFVGAMGRVVTVAQPEQTLRVMSANILTGNAEFESFESLIRADPPDILAVLETNAAWAADLERLGDLYPHRLSLPREDNFGLALLSRIAWESAGRTTLDGARGDVPSIEARYVIDGRPLTVIATHPLPPVGSWNWGSRNDQLRRIAARVATLDHAAIVMGDLNTPPWSPFYGDLLAGGGLRDTRAIAAGTSPTWHARRRWMRTPIDYVLHTSELGAIDHRTQRIAGSDHFAVRARLAWRLAGD